MPQAARIFVSHARKDSAWCHEFVSGLRSIGADVWYDEHDMGPGALMDVIEREILDRSIFVVVLSPHAVASRWVQREMQAAIILQDEQPERIIIPVQAEKGDIPVFWRTYVYLSGPGNTGLPATEAASRLAHILAIVPPAAPTAPVPDALSETAKQAWVRGKGLVAQRRYDEALAAYERAIQLDPADAKYWRSKGAALRMLGRLDETLAAYEQALTLNPKFKEAWNGKAATLWQLRRFEEALAAYAQALALDLKYKEAWNNKIELLDQLGRKAEADEARRQRDAALKGS